MDKKLIEKVRELTKEEIKKMLVVSVKNDIYSAKCFAFLLIEHKEIALNEKQCEILEKFIDLLSTGKSRQAVELINKKY